MFHYPDVDINNFPCVSGRVFVDDPQNAKVPTPELNVDDMKKVIPGFSFFHNARFDSFFEYAESIKQVPIDERKYDIAFMGTNIFGPDTPAGAWVTAHRRKCVENIRWLGANGFKVIATEGREYGNRQYLDILLQTKVFLSPFGWGEYCGKDFEALVSGCIVVKPQLPGFCKFLPNYHSEIKYINDFDHFNISNLHDLILNSKCDRDYIRKFLINERKNEHKIIGDILK
jgi:hypothetical protein